MDFSPLRGLPLSSLELRGTQFSDKDMSILGGMKLRNPSLDDTRVTHLDPLKGMPLSSLRISKTSVSDLSPRIGMQLECLEMTDSRVTDLEPLRGMKLKICEFTPRNIRSGIPGVRAMETLPAINSLAVAEFWKRYDAGEFRWLTVVGGHCLRRV